MILGLQQINNIITFAVPVRGAIGSGKRVFFPDVPQVAGRKVTGVCVYDNLSTENTPQGDPVTPANESDEIFLSLVDKNNRVFSDNTPMNFYNLLRFGQPLRNITPARELKVQSCFFTMSTEFANPETLLVSFFYD